MSEQACYKCAGHDVELFSRATQVFEMENGDEVLFRQAGYQCMTCGFMWWEIEPNDGRYPDANMTYIGRTGEIEWSDEHF